ncbi:MAG TPA: hypothetical protein VFM74_04560 [Candidatus Limnocylindria bacterium]|nr:hypothetical protein [Candidatus Limnocylindria bacterium]
MSARSLMRQRALVERSSSSGDDDFGNPLPEAWAPHITAMPCLLYGSTEREAVNESTTAVVADLRLLAPRSADVTESDRINGIIDRRGNVIRAGLLDIDTVLLKKDHLELTVTAVTS